MTYELIFWLECPCQRRKQEFYSLKIKTSQKEIKQSGKQSGAGRRYKITDRQNNSIKLILHYHMKWKN